MSDEINLDRLRDLRERIDAWIGWGDESVSKNKVQIAEEIQGSAWRLARGETVHEYEILITRGAEEQRMRVLAASHHAANGRGAALAKEWEDAAEGNPLRWTFINASFLDAYPALRGNAS